MGTRALVYTAGRDSNWHSNEPHPPHRRPKMTQTNLPQHPNSQMTIP